MDWMSLISGVLGASGGDGGGGADWSTGQYKGKAGTQQGHGMQLQTMVQNMQPPEGMMSMGGQMPTGTLDLSALLGGFQPQQQAQPQTQSQQRNPFLGGFSSLFQ